MSRIKQFDHVGITVADLDSVTAFFADLGLEVEGRTFVEGEFIDTVVGIPDSRTEIAHRDGQRAGSAQHLFRGRRPPGGRRRPGCERIRTGRRDRSAREHLADGPCARAGGNRRLADRADRLTPSGCPLPMRHCRDRPLLFHPDMPPKRLPDLADIRISQSSNGASRTFLFGACKN